MSKPVKVSEEVYLHGSGRCLYADERNNRWSFLLPVNHGKDQVMTPLYWRVFAGRMKNGDILEVRSDDERFYGEFYVVGVERDTVTLQEMYWMDIGQGNVSVDREEYEYRWKGPTLKHCVVRVSDGEIIVDRLPSKDAALAHISTMQVAA